jgi:hypothetical protein
VLERSTVGSRWRSKIAEGRSNFRDFLGTSERLKLSAQHTRTSGLSRANLTRSIGGEGRKKQMH